MIQCEGSEAGKQDKDRERSLTLSRMVLDTEYGKAIRKEYQNKPSCFNIINFTFTEYLLSDDDLVIAPYLMTFKYTSGKRKKTTFDQGINQKALENGKR